MKVYLIKNSKGDYLQSHVGYFDYSKSKDAYIINPNTRRREYDGYECLFTSDIYGARTWKTKDYVTKLAEKLIIMGDSADLEIVIYDMKMIYLGKTNIDLTKAKVQRVNSKLDK